MYPSDLRSTQWKASQHTCPPSEDSLLSILESRISHPLTLSKRIDTLFQSLHITGEAGHPSQVFVVLPLTDKVLEKREKSFQVRNSEQRT